MNRSNRRKRIGIPPIAPTSTVNSIAFIGFGQAIAHIARLTGKPKDVCWHEAIQEAIEMNNESDSISLAVFIGAATEAIESGLYSYSKKREDSSDG
jgi:hypothetical protein